MQGVQHGPAAAGSVQQSPFLRCLSQLNDDVLASYLLPKLVQQGSAGAAALSCSQLRRLCQPFVQHLDLTKQLQDGENPCHNPDLARQLVAAFPNCSSLNFAWDSSSMGNVYRTIGQLLTGLPHLSTVSIKLEKGGSECDLDPVLAQLYTHATGLHSFSLELGTSWEENPVAWASLDKLVSLTKLQIAFDITVTEPCSEHNMEQLTGLSKLLSLCIMAPGAEGYDKDEGQLLFPGRLACLTELSLPIWMMRDVSSVSECSNLCHLQLRTEPDEDGLAPGMWRAKHWDALASLTHLTYLHVDVKLYQVIHAGEENHPWEDPGVYYAVLKQLPLLRSVGAHTWTSGALPVLQSLTRVTAVYGGWDVPADFDVRVSLCPHVRELGKTWLRVPFQAFPNLTTVTFTWVFVEHLLLLSRHCTGLQRLALTPACPAMADDRGSDAACMSAMKSLANLHHLTHLEIAPRTDAGLMGYLSAAAALGSNLQLRYLGVKVPLSGFGLMHLLSVHGLQELSVHLTSTDAKLAVEGVGAWLVGLAAVPKVSLLLCSQEQTDVVVAAHQWAAVVELPLPPVLQVSLLPGAPPAWHMNDSDSGDDGDGGGYGDEDDGEGDFD